MNLREKHKSERRQQILDAARRLIRATGGTDFSMLRLAQEAEVSLITP
jgi:AcrR family transcriptional regulator